MLEKAQQPDGYLNSAVQVHGQPRYSNLAHSHEMHCAGHLIQAGVACLRGAGLDRLLGVARRKRSAKRLSPVTRSMRQFHIMLAIDAQVSQYARSGGSS